MASKEEILETKTFKNEGFNIGRRVFYTLAGEGKKGQLQSDYNSKAIAVLFETLHKKKVLTDKLIDDILFEVIS